MTSAHSHTHTRPHETESPPYFFGLAENGGDKAKWWTHAGDTRNETRGHLRNKILTLMWRRRCEVEIVKSEWDEREKGREREKVKALVGVMGTSKVEWCRPKNTGEGALTNEDNSGRGLAAPV